MRKDLIDNKNHNPIIEILAGDKTNKLAQPKSSQQGENMANVKNETVSKTVETKEVKVKVVKEGKFNYAIKQKAVEMALAGIHLKNIQAQIGPNPKATERYIVKAFNGKIPNFTCKFATYKEVLADLESRGITPQTVTQIAKAKEANKKV